MAALCEMKLNLQLAKYQHSDDPPIWVLSSPEAEIPLAFVDELEDEEGQEILRLGGGGPGPNGCWCATRRRLTRCSATCARSCSGPASGATWASEGSKS